MFKTLFLMLQNLIGKSGARILSGLGIGLFSFAAVGPAVLIALNAVVTAFGGMAADIQAICLMSGFGFAMNTIGSAVLTRLALNSGMVGVKKK